jgi:hypothetical protein
LAISTESGDIHFRGTSPSASGTGVFALIIDHFDRCWPNFKRVLTLVCKHEKAQRPLDMANGGIGGKPVPEFIFENF